MRRLPRAALVCALVALVNGLVWTALIPPFQVPDENAHVSYAQYLAETGRIPVRVKDEPAFSEEERATLTAIRIYGVIGQSNSRPPLTPAETRPLRAINDLPLSRVGRDAATATSNPPAYYLLAAVPYWLSPSKALVDRLVLMRFLSVLLSACTVLVIYCFLRELLPSTPWAWTVGALAAALQPTFGFMSGGVNNDALLYLASALTFLALARALRRGLDVRTGLAIGGAVALGVLTKLTYLGLLPGAALGVVITARQAGRANLRAALKGAAAAGAIVVGLVGIYWLLSQTVWDRGLSTPSPNAAAAQEAGTFRDQLSFMWQLFLPRLPGMVEQMPGFPLRELWWRGFTGRFGWLDYGYPGWVYDVSWWVAVAILAAAISTAIKHWSAVRARLGELLTYAALLAGLLAAIGVADYSAHITREPAIEQGRYLLPVLSLYAAVIALAARGAGRRWGPVIGAVLVIAALAETLFAQLLTISRFYG